MKPWQVLALLSRSEDDPEEHETGAGPTLSGRFGPRVLTCSTHGRFEWDGTAVCAGCDRVWRLSDDAPPTEQPHPRHGTACVCGLELTKHARAICERCYIDRRGKNAPDPQGTA